MDISVSVTSGHELHIKILTLGLENIANEEVSDAKRHYLRHSNYAANWDRRENRSNYLGNGSRLLVLKHVFPRH